MAAIQISGWRQSVKRLKPPLKSCATTLPLLFNNNNFDQQVGENGVYEFPRDDSQTNIGTLI